MKKLLLSLIIVLSIININKVYSQSIGIGFGYNTEKQYMIDLKCYDKDNIIISLDVDFTGNTNKYPIKYVKASEIIGDVIETDKLLNSTTVNVGFGGHYYSQWFIVGLVGFNIKDYQTIDKTKNITLYNSYHKSFNIGVEFGYFILPSLVISTEINLIGNAGIKLGFNL